MIIANNDTTSFAVPCRAEIGVTMIRIVLCDDNQPFLTALRTNIRNVLNAHKIDAEIHIFDDAYSMPDHILTSSDIFFLDIDFSEKEYNGIDIAKKIRRFRQDSIIVFVTNYIEYAPEGYEVQAFRYCLKNEVHLKLEQYLLQTITKLKDEQETIQINISGETITLPLSDILYIESQGHTAVIHIQKPGTQNRKSYKFYATLISLEQSLAERGFLRIHKSYLVNMRRMKKFQCTEAILDTGVTLKVSEKNYAEQKKKYLLWKGRQ